MQKPVTTTQKLIAAAEFSYNESSEKSFACRSGSATTSDAAGNRVTCCVKSRAPNSRGNSRGRHASVTFVINGKTRSRKQAEEILACTNGQPVKIEYSQIKDNQVIWINRGI